MADEPRARLVWRTVVVCAGILAGLLLLVAAVTMPDNTFPSGPYDRTWAIIMASGALGGIAVLVASVRAVRSPQSTADATVAILTIILLFGVMVGALLTWFRLITLPSGVD